MGAKRFAEQVAKYRSITGRDTENYLYVITNSTEELSQHRKQRLQDRGQEHGVKIEFLTFKEIGLNEINLDA